MTTTIIRSLSDVERVQLEGEIVRAPKELWIKHISEHYSAAARASTFLLDGTTIHLNWPVSRSELLMPTQQPVFPYLMSFIHSIIDGGKLGRAYIHKLASHNFIRRHHDRRPKMDTNIITRYQIYFDIPSPSVLFLDDEIVSDSSRYRYSLVDFDLTRLHEYINLSDRDWFFVVFDLVER